MRGRAIAYTSRQRIDLILLAGCGALLAMPGAVLYGSLFHRSPAQDFMVFYNAARDVIDGDLALLADGAAFTAQLNDRFGAWLTQPLDLHPWMYPPTTLLLVAPLGWLPFPLAYAGFMGGTFAALNGAMGCLLHRGDQRRLCVAALLLSPATAFTLAVGQNSFLTTALMVGGFGWMGRAPVLAGILLGSLTVKPQLWLLVPVALIAAREWTVLGCCLATAAVLGLVSLAAFGPAPWLAWLTLMLRPSPQYQEWVDVGRLSGQSIYAVSVLLGGSAAAAGVLQTGASLCCAGLVWRAFRTAALTPDLRLALLLVATILAAPHVANYDAVMVTAALVLLSCRALTEGFRRGELLLIIVAAGIELLNPPRVVPLGVVTPLVLCAVLAAIMSRRTPAGRAGATDGAGPAKARWR